MSPGVTHTCVLPRSALWVKHGQIILTSNETDRYQTSEVDSSVCVLALEYQSVFFIQLIFLLNTVCDYCCLTIFSATIEDLL